MIDREKVIKGLEWCMNEKHDCYREKGCPYENEGEDIGCKYALHRDAIALLKALDVTPEELERLKKCRHECKIDCLLEHYERIKDERDALLKEQEPRVMKIGDVRNWVNSDRVTREPIVIEIRSGVCAWIIDDEVRELPGEADLSSDLYGKTWRCWTSRPDQATREATPWSEQDQREYQAAVEMAEYCERYEPTYNAEDGSM